LGPHFLTRIFLTRNQKQSQIFQTKIVLKILLLENTNNIAFKKYCVNNCSVKKYKKICVKMSSFKKIFSVKKQKLLCLNIQKICIKKFSVKNTKLIHKILLLL